MVPHFENNVKLRVSRHWGNVNVCCDVGLSYIKSCLGRYRIIFPQLSRL